MSNQIEEVAYQHDSMKDERIDELEAADELRKNSDKEFYEREALRQRKLKDLRGQQIDSAIKFYGKCNYSRYLSTLINE